VSNLAAALGRGWAVVAEVSTPRSAGRRRLESAIQTVGPLVDALAFADNPGAIVHMASIAGCALALQAGIEPVLHVSCRDRTLAGIQSDVLGAHVLGVRNVLVITGDDPRDRELRPYAPVWQVRAPEALAALDELRRTGGPDARRPAPVPLWLGGAAQPEAPREAHFAHLQRKSRGGADFFVTQLVTDVEAFGRWMRAYRAVLGGTAPSVLAGIGLLRSARTVDFLNRGVSGIRIPDSWRSDLTGSGDPDTYAVERAAAMIAGVREIEGVGGVYLITLGWHRGVQHLAQSGALAAEGRARR
jgi:methylenetetrahydrofolate reductase (NADPH)